MKKIMIMATGTYENIFLYLARVISLSGHLPGSIFSRDGDIIIHLLHAGEGNMKIYSPNSNIFPEGNARGEYDTRG
jgi:hypothetical protein